MMVAVATNVLVMLTSAASHARPPSGYPSRNMVMELRSPPRRGAGPDEGAEQPVILARLRVPLDGEPETRRGMLHRLQRAVLCPRRRHIAGMTGHGLVVIARYVDLLPEHGTDRGAFNGTKGTVS